MPLRTKTYDLGEEVQRLEDRADELDDVLEGVEDGNPAAKPLQSERGGLETVLEGVRWARDDAFEADFAPQWDEDVDEITFGGLTAGELAQLQDDIGTNGGGSGAARIYQVAKGTVDAPYIDEDANEDQRIGAVSGLPGPFVKWAESRIDQLTGVGGNGEVSYRELYEEMQPDESDQA